MTYKEIRDLIGKVLALEAKIAALPTTDDGYLIGDEADDYEEFSEQMAIMAPPLARELQRLLAEHADGAWVFAADLRRALEGKEAVSNDPLVLEVQNLRTAYADALADADASQHWRTRALRAEEALEEARVDAEGKAARLDVMETERNEARDERDDLAEQIAAIGTWIDARTDAPRTADSGQPLTLVQRLNATRAEFVRVREERDTAQDLVSRAIANAGRHAARPLWSHIMHLFAVGSTRAHALCAEHGYDPDQEVGPSKRPQRKA